MPLPSRDFSVQLRRVVPALAADDVALFPISYDTIAILSAFAETHGIGYGLLSDEGSLVMPRLGLVNERVQEHHASRASPPLHAT